MLNRFRTILFLFRHFGWKWLIFRAGYALRMRLGMMRWPRSAPAYGWEEKSLEDWIRPEVPRDAQGYVQWRADHVPVFLFQQISPLPENVPWNPETAVQEAEKILAGEFKYFEQTYYKIGFPPDWFLDPSTQTRLDPHKHWTQISLFGACDIKYVWEASRFQFVYTLARAYAHRPDERFAEAFWFLTEDWARNNSPNTGPNWMDGQEQALRLMAWCFGLMAFGHSPAATPQRIAQLTVMIAAHAQRIHQNIDFAVSTRGNHAITEAFGLWLAGLFFPELKDAEKYLSLGRTLLEREAAAQIFADGGYSMYSLNYQRFILHVYFYALRLGELNQHRFSESVYRALDVSLQFILQLIEPRSGQMPEFGSNDGALVLPLDTCDYSDYRPVLQLGHYLLHGKRLFEKGAWDEDLYWFFGQQALDAPMEDHAPRQTSQNFEQAGVYTLRSPQGMAVIRCTEYRARPSHADQLHLDLWWRGQNIACDAGTYLYNGEGIWQNGLAHTPPHNTVTVDSVDQMVHFERFTWVHWAQGRVLHHNSSAWQGEHDGYLRLADPVKHKRMVLMLEGERWLIVDHLRGAQIHHYALQWLLGDFPFTTVPEQNLISLRVEQSNLHVQMGLMEGNAKFSVVRGDPNSTRGWRSRTYGQKQPAASAMLEADRAQACFWTFFGFEGDSVRLEGETLNIVSAGRQVRYNLANPDALNSLP